MSDNTPYERYVKQGIFKLTESEVETKNGNKLITKTYVTGKGQLYLAKKLAQYFASQSASAQRGDKEWKKIKRAFGYKTV